MEMLEYNPGDAVPVTSSLYRVVHDPPGSEQHPQTFHVGENFPPCSDCGPKVRYLLPIRVFRNAIEPYLKQNRDYHDVEIAAAEDFGVQKSERRYDRLAICVERSQTKPGSKLELLTQAASVCENSPATQDCRARLP